MKFLFAYKTIKNKVNYITKGDIIQRFKEAKISICNILKKSQIKMKKQTEKGKLLKNYVKHLWKHSVRHKIIMVRRAVVKEDPRIREDDISEPETIAYLREKNQSSVELQKEQLALQKAELDMKMEQNNRLNQLLFNQQIMFCSNSNG